MANNNKTICLTLDLECDYGTAITKKTYYCLEKIESLIDILRDRDIPLTCFVQTSILQSHPHVIEKLKRIDVEFEPHSHNHTSLDISNTEFEINKSINTYREFFKECPVGYRFPNGVLNSSDYKLLEKRGIKYDSSIFPSWRPGHFNNLGRQNLPHYPNGSKVFEIPFTVISKRIRIPIALSYFKLLGLIYLTLIEKTSLPNLIIFDFHMHDLIVSPTYNDLPLFYKMIYGRNKLRGLEYLTRFIEHLQSEEYKFIKMKELYSMMEKKSL